MLLRSLGFAYLLPRVQFEVKGLNTLESIILQLCGDGIETGLVTGSSELFIRLHW